MPPPPAPTELVPGIKLFAVLRLLGILTAVAVILAFELAGLLPFDARPVLLYFMPAYYLAGWLMWFVLKGSVRTETALIALNVFDAVAVTVGLTLTGGADSPFAVFLLVVLISASLISLRGTVTTGTAILLLYGGLVLTTPLSGDEIIRAVTFAFAVSIVAFQSYTLISRVRARDRELTKQKEDFLFRTVHDIRAPATVIRYAVEGTRDPALPAVVLESYDEIERATTRINNMVTDLMKVARGEAAAIAFTLVPVDVTVLTGKLVKNLQGAAAEKKVTLVYARPESLPQVTADAERLEEALANLVENAIKYNRSGGAVTVRHARDGNRVLIQVQDTGIGIEAGNIPNLFQPYFREVRDPQVPGTGLGLFAVRKLVEGMGGTISVESVVGTGSTFTIALPAAGT